MGVVAWGCLKSEDCVLSGFTYPGSRDQCLGVLRVSDVRSFRV